MEAPRPPETERTDTGWTVRRSTGDAGPFHAAEPGAGLDGDADRPVAPEVWIHCVERPALVVGSTQSLDVVDADRAAADGVEVCRRRSGGGLVYVDPDTDCWVDLIVPPGSDWWDADVGRAFHRTGEHWAAVLASLLPAEAPTAVRPRVHRERDGRTDRFWCFAGVGHGEVTAGGRKVVGLSQRRTRSWIRIQSVVAGSWPAERLRRYVRGVDGPLDPALVRAGLPPEFGRPEPAALAHRFTSTIPPP